MKGVRALPALIVVGAHLGGCGRHALPAVDVDAYEPKLRYGMSEAEVVALIGSKPLLSDDTNGVKTLNYLDSKNRRRFLELLFHDDKLASAKYDVEVDVPKDRDRDLFRTDRRIDLPGDPRSISSGPPPGSLPTDQDQ